MEINDSSIIEERSFIGCGHLLLVISQSGHQQEFRTRKSTIICLWAIWRRFF